jgi:hypothetical protein
MSVINPNLVEIRDEGVSQGRALAINFTGAGVTASVAGFVSTVNISGGGGGGASATRVTVVFPLPNCVSQLVTVTDAAVTLTSKILAWISGLPDSNVLSSMEDSLVIQALAGTGNFILSVQARQPIGGSFSFDYMVLS